MVIIYNPEIHKRKSIRLKGYDYSCADLYFITICTKNKEPLFGDIDNAKMIFSDGGNIAQRCWQDIPKHYPETKLYEYIIMPNHVHGIIQITNENVGACPRVQRRVQNFEPFHNKTLQHDSPKNNHPSKANQYQKVIPKSIGSIIRGFKIGVTKWFRQNTEIHSIWQRGFYERIIRNEQAYFKISEYINDNPLTWQKDRYHA